MVYVCYYYCFLWILGEINLGVNREIKNKVNYFFFCSTISLKYSFQVPHLLTRVLSHNRSENPLILLN